LAIGSDSAPARFNRCGKLPTGLAGSIDASSRRQSAIVQMNVI
jgi:hypothetical protein